MDCCCCSINSLREKEVVNLCDGNRLGYICDIEIDITSGRIISIIVPGDNRFFSISLNKTTDIRISWDKINRIGDDIILVTVPVNEINQNVNKKKNWFNFN